MTIQQLCNLSADQLEKMVNPSILQEHFGPLLKITRPDLAIKERGNKQRSNPKQQELIQLSPEEQIKRQKVADILADLGMNIEDLEN